MVKKNAGYTIRESKKYRTQENGDNYVVLAENERTGMWVTWECTNGSDFYWGHYYENENDATRDYYNRLAEKYNRPWNN